MPRHLVFVGAPTSVAAREEILDSSASYKWRTVIANHPPAKHELTESAASVLDVSKLSSTTLEEASRRISRLYEHIIFSDAEDPEEDDVVASEEFHDTQERATTMISWPSTLHTAARNNNESRAVGRPDTTFLRPTASFSRFIQHRQRKETQGTQETNSYSFSYNDSSDASVARFPHFHFSLHSLTSLSSLSNQLKGPRVGENHGDFPRSSKLKVNILVAVLGTEGPDTIRIKSGLDAGKEVCLFKIVIGDEEGQVCKLTAWREVAERWGGVHPGETQTQRGDIVYLQDILASHETSRNSDSSNITLTASPASKSAMLICYRTMPRVPDREADVNDERFRPDLRLGLTDAAVRKVANIVKWFEATAGLPHDR